MNINHPYNKLWIGIAIGLLVPFTAYGILLMIYDQLDAFGILNPTGMSLTFRERTIALIAIIANILPVQLLNRRHMLDAMRGVVFPTLVYVIAWMYYYGMDLLG